jgi:hypothetical protein
MTYRHYDTHIRIKPNALIQGLYSGLTYTAIDELSKLEVIALLERNHYVFTNGFVPYAVSPDDIEVLEL